MPYTEQLTRKQYSRTEMMKRVARFADLEGFDGGLADSLMPGWERILYNVLGFQPPEGEAGAIASPVGAQAARHAAIKVSEGFNIGFCRALPGKGPLMHNHDTNETFIGISGRWRACWENEQGAEEFVELDPLDTISFPPGAVRRFMNVTPGDSQAYATILFVIGGDAPSAEFSREAIADLEVAGHWQP